MPEQKMIDWVAVQKERNAGVPAGQLAAKYKCSSALIYTRTKAPKEPAAPAKATERVKKIVSKKINDLSIDALIGKLEDRKAECDKAIAELEAMRELFE